MKSLNVNKLSPEQLEWLAHKLSNYALVNYDSLMEKILQIDKNYPYSMPTWLIILITVLGSFIITVGIGTFLYGKYKCSSNQSKTLMFWCKNNQKETGAMLPSSSQQSITSPKVWTNFEKVRETLKLLGIYFSYFDKYKAHIK